MTKQTESSQSWIEKLQFLSETKQFLNKEFLTWIWYFAEKHTGPIEFSPREDVELLPTKKPLVFYLWIDDKLVLESLQRGHEKTLQHSLKGGDPSKSPEASVALLGGKIVKELKLGIRIIPLGDFTATLNGTDLNPRSLTIPKATDEIEEKLQDPFLYRIHAARLFIAALDHIVSIFLAERMKDQYESEVLPHITRWISEKNRGKQPIESGVIIH